MYSSRLSTLYVLLYVLTWCITEQLINHTSKRNTTNLACYWWWTHSDL